jgi:hypothetical protein
LADDLAFKRLDVLVTLVQQARVGVDATLFYLGSCCALVVGYASPFVVRIFETTGSVARTGSAIARSTEVAGYFILT